MSYKQTKKPYYRKERPSGLNIVSGDSSVFYSDEMSSPLYQKPHSPLHPAPGEKEVPGRFDVGAVYEVLDNGEKVRISYEEGIKKANQLKHIVFSGDYLIKALETGALDEFKNDPEATRKMIEEERRKMKGGLSDEEMQKAKEIE